MTDCDFCDKEIDGLPFKCRFCGSTFCSKHHLPEDHKCPGLEKYKQGNTKRWVEAVIGPKRKKYYKKPKRKLSESKKVGKKVKAFLLNLFYDTKDFFMHRNHRRYDYSKKINYIGSIILKLVISLVALIILYSNIKELNEIKIWFILLGGTLLLVSAFFFLKYGWKFLKEVGNWFKRQRNWLKFIVVILIFILLWQAYTNKETVLNPILDKYHEINFSLFMPVNFGNLSTESDGTTFSNWKNSLKDYSSYETNSKTVKLSGVGEFVVYGGVNNYLAGKDRSISYYYVSPTTKDFILRDLDEDVQKVYLDPLVSKIKNKSNDSKEQARIAIRMVQAIPYDWSAFESDNVDGRYPYEVLYDMEGVCMEKADLIAYLLRGLGFGVAIFEYNFENHRAVGIKCGNGNYGSNYCFIEATDYYPIGQIPNNYVGGADIRGATPEIVIISDGLTYPK